MKTGNKPRREPECAVEWAQDSATGAKSVITKKHPLIITAHYAQCRKLYCFEQDLEMTSSKMQNWSLKRTGTCCQLQAILARSISPLVYMFPSYNRSIDF